MTKVKARIWIPKFAKEQNIKGKNEVRGRVIRCWMQKNFQREEWGKVEVSVAECAF